MRDYDQPAEFLREEIPIPLRKVSMKRTFIFWPAAFAATVFFQQVATAADTYAFVAKTTNASTLSFLSAPSGKQTSALALGIDTGAGAVYSSDGTLAFVIQTQQPGGEARSVKVYDLATGKLAGTATVPSGAIEAAVPSSDSSRLYLLVSNSNLSGSIYAVDLATFKASHVYTVTAYPEALAISPSGDVIYLASGNGLSLISTNTFTQIASFAIQNISRITVSPDGERLYLSQVEVSSGMIVALDVKSGTAVGTLPADAYAYVAVSADSSLFYTTVGSVSGHVTVEQVQASNLSVTRSLVLGPNQNTTAGPPLAISPGGATLAIEYGEVGPSVTLVALPSLQRESMSPVGNVCGVGFTPNNNVAVTNCGADTVEVVDVTTRKPKGQFDAGPSPQTTLPRLDGAVVYVANTYGVWALSPQTGKVLSKIEFPALAVSPQLALSADGSTLFASHSSGVAEISTATNRSTGLVSGIPSGFAVSAIATSPDGKYLFVSGAFSSDPNTYDMLVLNQSTGALINSVVAPSLGLYMVVSKDSSNIYYEGIFREGIYSLYTFLVSTSVFSATQVFVDGGGMALSPDGSTLYLANIPLNAIEAFDTASQTVVSLPSPEPPVDVAVTPDGSELVVTSAATSLGLINVASPIIGAVIPVGGGTSGISVH